MIRNLKTLGLALVAMLAMGVVTASAAQADKFTADEYPATLHGVQVASERHVFTTQGGRQVTCETATFAGTLPAASNTVTISPTYENCQALVLGSKLPATVTKTNPCDYVFTLPETPNETKATVDVNCTFVVDIYANHADHTAGLTLCQLHIGPQKNLELVELANHANGDVTANASVTGIAYTRTGSLSCGVSGNGTYTGNTVVSGINNAGNPVNWHVL